MATRQHLSHMDAVAAFHALGCNALYIDYRGYGQSTGTPYEQGLYTDAATAWHYLTGTRGLTANNIIIVGRSLGGGVASWLALEYQPRALILQATFTALVDVAAPRYPLLPVRWFINEHFPTSKRLPQLQMPLLIVHPLEDRSVPFINGLHLYALANEPRWFVELPRGTHRSAFVLCDEEHRAGLRAFLDRVL
ncbi:MAG: alpha/beta hydrolase [Chloroflexaceae bacterium]|nr:alpha/beta hydrolase [Chloroflexaceae bacterium]